MGISERFNFRKQRGVLRSLDYTNMPPEKMQELGISPSGRPSETLYEGARRVLTPEDMGGAEDGVHEPMSGERPHPRAQWDEAGGRWIVWSADAGDWVPVEAEG